MLKSKPNINLPIFAWHPFPTTIPLDKLLESTIHRRSRLDALVEVDSGQSTFADTFWRELEFLKAA